MFEENMLNSSFIISHLEQERIFRVTNFILYKTKINYS